MSFESPFSVLFDSEGVELSVTASQDSGFVSGTQPGILLMGSSSVGAQFLKLETDGTAWVTGAVTTFPGADTVISGLSFDPDGNLITTISGANVTADGALIVTGTLSTVALNYPNSLVSGADASTTSFTILPSNTSRGGASFFLDGRDKAFIKLGPVASQTSFTVILRNNAFYEIPPHYIGQVDVVFNKTSANTTLYVTEITT